MTDVNDKPRVHDDLLPPMSRMSSDKISCAIDTHQSWLQSGGKDGARANFFHCDLREGNLKKMDLRDADLSMCDLREVDLRFADLREATLQGSDLLQSNLRNANLERANLVSAHLVGANLTDVTLRQACLMDAQLQDADLTGVDLEGANFRFAEFERATFHRARLVKTDLRRWYLDEEQLDGACGDDKTKLLDGVKFRLCSDPAVIVFWKTGKHGPKLMSLKNGELIEL
jgi:uncharacterized protein YjbI with pentapeptide repeats